jgi:DNA-binding transcriptional MerR regulator
MPGSTRTLSATEFSEITGVSRERLRTWERRHGFPEPHRVGKGPRRYAVDDAPRVVAVRRAIEGGVPVTVAIKDARAIPRTGLTDTARAALAEHAPIAIVVVSGPEPVRVEEVNAVVRARPGAPVPGDDLLAVAPWYAEHPGCARLMRLFAGDSVATSVEHPDWMAGMAATANAIAYRLPQEAGRAPLIALVGIDTARERQVRRDLHDVEEERAALRDALDRQARWAEATAAVVRATRRHSGTDALAAAADELVRHAGVLDAAIAPYMTGSLVLGRSSRGLLGPAMVTVAAYEELAAVLRDDEPEWLGRSAAGALGAPDGVHAYVVPVVAAGETLGALVLLADERENLADVPGHLFETVSTVVGFALMRERVVDELRG